MSETKPMMTSRPRGFVYHNLDLYDYQNVARHRDKIKGVTENHQEIKDILSRRFNPDIASMILSKSPLNTLHPHIKEDIERVADKFTRNRKNSLSTYPTHKYSRKKK